MRSADQKMAVHNRPLSVMYYFGFMLLTRSVEWRRDHKANNAMQNIPLHCRKEPQYLTCLTRESWWPWKRVLKVSQVGYIRSCRIFIARFRGPIASHFASASTQTLDLEKEKKSCLSYVNDLYFIVNNTSGIWRGVGFFHQNHLIEMIERSTVTSIRR